MTVGPSSIHPLVRASAIAAALLFAADTIVLAADPEPIASPPAAADTTWLQSPPADPAPAPPATSTPEPEHSGFKALFGATVSDFKSFPQRPSTWVILGGGAVGALAVHPFDDTFNAHLQNDTSDKFWAAGKWMGNAYVVSGAAVGMYLIGRWMGPDDEKKPHTSKLGHIGFDLIRSEILSQALVQGIKFTAQRDRPTGECCAFPSGHAATAFATAAVLERHFGYRGSWPALVAATYVAMSRLHDDRHFLSDVVFGAAVGTAAGWTVVGRHGRNNYTMTPVAVPGGMAVMVFRQP